MGNTCSNSNKVVNPVSIGSVPLSSTKGGNSTTTTGKASAILPPLAAGTDEAFTDGRILETPNVRMFTLAELRNATRNFKAEYVLGEGGFGKVFKGWVDEKTFSPAKSGSRMVVAVKKLNPEGMQGFEEWQSEVNFMGRLSHPNLVKLLGYCLEEKDLLLVYEFMSKGSLENHLFRRGAAFDPLSWSLRLKIAIGAARGLAFLHSSEKRVIYRDFKASNILLDPNYNAKLSDFGLAKYGPAGSDSHITTRVLGTCGYAAPEYVATGHLYVKSDVYGFGVVLLEILSGQRALDTTRPSDRHNLVDWAKPFLLDRKKLARMMDPKLEGKYPSKGALQIAQLTLRCLENEPKSRPSMKEVLETLEDIEAMKDLAREAKKASSENRPRRHGQAPVHPRSPHGVRQRPEVGSPAVNRSPRAR